MSMARGTLLALAAMVAVLGVACAGTQVLTVGAGRPLNRMLLGLNDVLGPVVNLSYTDPGLVLAATSLGVGALRHPGGTVANYWQFSGRYVDGCTPGAAPHIPGEPSGGALCGCCEFAPGVAARPAGFFAPKAFTAPGAVGGVTPMPPVFE